MTNSSAKIGVPETGGRQRVKQAALQTIRERFSHIQPIWVERHLGVLIALRAEFGADIDKAIILGLIGQRMMKMKDAPTLTYADMLTDEVPAMLGRFTNIESIAAASGIPRETVRRKVRELEERGWIKRNQRDEIDLTILPIQHLDSISRLSMELLASVFEAINHEFRVSDADRA
jgi:DNA-binding MarR family transcriptional regulator